MTELKVRLTFTEDLLGTASNNPEIHKEFISSKAPDARKLEEEVATVGVQEMVEKGTTVFPRNADGVPFIYDYQVRGFFKEACSCLRMVPHTLSSKYTSYKKKIDGLILVKERRIPLNLHGMDLIDCQRPLRAETQQGPRTSLAHSEVAPAGTTVEFTVQCLVDDQVNIVKEWLEYGVFKGLGQWRNSGKGRFTVEYLGMNISELYSADEPIAPAKKTTRKSKKA